MCASWRRPAVRPILRGNLTCNFLISYYWTVPNGRNRFKSINTPSPCNKAFNARVVVIMWAYYVIQRFCFRLFFQRQDNLDSVLESSFWDDLKLSIFPGVRQVIIIIISIQPEGRLWQEPEPSQATGMALAHCILGSFLRAGCHCFPPPLDVPTFASRCLHVQATWETSISERRNYGREMAGQFCLWFRLPHKPRVLWHAAQICDMGDGFTSPPRKACCGFFRPNNPTASAGIEPAILGTRGQHANH